MGYGKALYGGHFYADENSNTEDEKFCVDLMKYLPEYWHTVEEMKLIQSMLGEEVANVIDYKKDIINQMFIEAATWGLSRWEKIFDLETDVNKSYEFRRERIRAKIRGSGTTTKQLIINVASSFSGGEVEVIEQPEQSSFIIKFIGVKGIPANMVDLTNTINEIKPAHLAFSFEYTYNYWNTLIDRDWSTLNKSSWEQVKTV